MDEESLVKDAAAAVQLLQQQQQQQTASSSSSASSTASPAPPPTPLPIHWVIRESRSQPGYYYYFNHETGVCSWYPPQIPLQQQEPQPPVSLSTKGTTTTAHLQNNNATKTTADQKYSLEELGNLSAAVVAAAAASGNIAPTTTASEPTNHSVDSTNNHQHHNPSSKRSISEGSTAEATSNKRSHHTNHSTPSGSSNNGHVKAKSPHEVRVLHILKKHRGSRKPTSWRVPVITATKDEAREELQALLDVLRDVQDDPQELRATVEELARTESDCSSYKRNGDLGYFTRKKMQPQFEDTAFSLQVNELSDIIETSSGLHVLLRIG